MNYIRKLVKLINMFRNLVIQYIKFIYKNQYFVCFIEIYKFKEVIILIILINYLFWNNFNLRNKRIV